MRDLQCKRYQQMEIKGVKNVGNIEISAFGLQTFGSFIFMKRIWLKKLEQYFMQNSYVRNKYIAITYYREIILVFQIKKNGAKLFFLFISNSFQQN